MLAMVGTPCFGVGAKSFKSIPRLLFKLFKKPW